MNTCKNCIYFDNSKPVDTTHNDNDKCKTAEPYIGKCKEIGRIKMMNDTCCLFKSKEENKCNKQHCEGCESFDYTSSVLDLNKLHIRCNKTNQFGVVDLGHTVKPEDFYEEEK